jgi:hypothetical protein
MWLSRVPPHLCGVGMCRSPLELSSADRSLATGDDELSHHNDSLSRHVFIGGPSLSLTLRHPQGSRPPRGAAPTTGAFPAQQNCNTFSGRVDGVEGLDLILAAVRQHGADVKAYRDMGLIAVRLHPNGALLIYRTAAPICDQRTSVKRIG